MNYTKYVSNGTLPELNKHYCMCCHKLKNNMEIFVFNLDIQSTTIGHWIPFYKSIQKQTRRYYDSLAREHGIRSAFLCAECIIKLYKDVSQETIRNLVVDKL